MFDDIKNDQFREYMEAMTLEEAQEWLSDHEERMTDAQYDIAVKVADRKQEERELEIELQPDESFERLMEYRSHVTS